MAPGPGDHVVVCGFGRVGQGIVDLLGRLGTKVTVITRTAPDPGMNGALGASVRILVGDARDEKLLGEAAIGSARALIVATDDDLANVTIALRAHRMNPAVPVVVRLFDQDLAVHLEAAAGIRCGFSASALSAPAFVAAALGDTIRLAFDVGGESWTVEEIRASDQSEQVVVARQQGDEWLIAPESTRGASAGDKLIVLRRAAPELEGQANTRGVATLLRGLRAWWQETPRGLRFALYALLALVSASVILFHATLGLPAVDAYYFVITTLTTTGYGDINLQTAHPLLKIYGTLVMVSGGALFAVVFSMITDLLLRTRFGDVLARGVSRHRGHVIVAGLGHTGFRVLRELRRLGQTTVAIECRDDAPFVAAARTLSPVVTGNAGADEMLGRAGLTGAKTVVALTGNDLTNMSIALATKRAHPACRAVVRIFDSGLAAQLEHQLGIDAVLSLSSAAAPTFAGAAFDPDVVRGFVLHRWLLLIVERVIGQPSGPSGELRHERTLLCRPRGARRFEPLEEGRVAEPGDEAILVRWMELRV